MEIGNDSGASIVVTEMLNSFAGIWSKMMLTLQICEWQGSIIISLSAKLWWFKTDSVF